MALRFVAGVVCFFLVVVGSESKAGASCTPRWRVVAAGAGVPMLSGVAAISHTNVWAVGYTVSRAGVIRAAAIAHWDGRRLRVTQLFRARPADGRDAGNLFDIDALSGRDVWVAGDDGRASTLLHWNGSRWRIAATRRGQYAFLALNARSRADVWVVGGRFIGRWDGRRWRGTRRFAGTLSDVDGASSTDVWAVGNNDTGAGSYNSVDGVIVHSKGGRWRVVPAPVPDDAAIGYEAADSFNAVDARATTRAWAVHQASVRGDIPWGAETQPGRPGLLAQGR